MFSESVLAANIAALERTQGQVPALSPLDPERVRALSDGAAGIRLEMRTQSGDWIPLGDASTTEFPTQLFVIGPALGTVLDAIERVGAPTRVVALEPDPGVAVLMMARRDWTQWLESGRLRLLTGPDYRGFATCSRQVNVAQPPLVIAHPVLAEHRPSEVAAAQSVAKRMIAEAEKNAEARRRFAGRYLLQTLSNLPMIASEGDAGALDNLFAGKPAVVVGAGPSLDDNLAMLSALQDRVVIIGADTTLRPMLAAGVRPHIVAGVDPGEMNARHLAGVAGLDDVHLVAEGSLNPIAFEGFAGRTFVFKVSEHEPWPWLASLGLGRATLRAWGSVVTSAFDLALRLGCNPILFAGLDLSFPVRRPYCSNTIYDGMWRETMETYGCTWEQILDDYFGRFQHVHLPDVHGKPVLTSGTLVSFRNWLCEQIAATPNRRFVNTTGAGLLHGVNIEQGALRDLVETAPVIGDDVRAALRGVHARSVGASACLRREAVALARDAGHPRNAKLLADWKTFTADTVSAAEICERLESVLPRLAGAIL
jgi:hypothetical protein